MQETLLKVGIPGIFAILVLREVLPFVVRKANGNVGGVVKRDEFEAHKKTVQWKDVCEANLKRIDGRLDAIDNRLKDGFTEVKKLIRNGT